MRWIENAQEKKRICLAILNALPDWFGIPESIAEYGETVQALPFLVHEEDGQPVAFVALKETSVSAVEIHVMGIHLPYHRKGIGRQLVAACEAYARAHGMPLLHVKTLSDAVGNAAYLKTYAFYRAQGFLPLEVLPLWDEHNPCLLLVKPLAENGA